MNDSELFSRALGLREPWRVVDVRFDVEQRRLDLRIDFPKGSRFACPECGREGCPVHDTELKTWRHLNFFEHQAYLTARVPRVICPEHEVKQVEVPWARERSGFTLLFEALVMALVKEMPVAAVAALIGETDRARALCQKLLSFAGPLLLYAEEIDPATGEHLGNFPQAFTHLALIEAVSLLIASELAEDVKSAGWDPAAGTQVRSG